MQEVIQMLERNVKDVQYGSVSVELRIHEGRVVKAIYKTAKTTVKLNQNQKEEQNG